MNGSLTRCRLRGDLPVTPTPAQQTAQNRIHDLLAELADLVGPGFDGQADDELDADEMPEGHVFLSEWVTVMAWVDETGQEFTTRVTSANLAAHHRAGLLHEGLWAFGDSA